MLKRHTKAKSEFIVGELVQEEKKSEPVFISIAKKMNEHSLHVPFQCCIETKRQFSRN